MKRIILFVSGNVQRGGYRDRVVEIARRLDLKGYAENLSDGRVKILAEGEEKKLEHLERSVDIKNTLISVEKIESSFSEATGEFSGFFKLVGKGETDERLDTAAVLLKELIEVNRNGFGETISAIKSVKADTSAMREELRTGFAEVKEEMRKGFGEVKGEMQKGFGDMRNGFAEVKEEMHKGFGDMQNGLAEVRDEVHLQRDDFRELFMHEVTELRGEIAEVKATLARMQAGA